MNLPTGISMPSERQKPLPEGQPLPRYEGPKPGQMVEISIEVLRGLVEKGNTIRATVVEGPDPEALIVAVDVDWFGQKIRLHYDRPVTDPILTKITP